MTRIASAVVSIWALAAALLLPPGNAATESQATLVSARPALREVRLTGFTRARALLPLVAETSARVERVAYEVGERIGEQGIFAKLDDTFIGLELEEVRIAQERLRTQIAYDQREVERYAKLAQENNASASKLDLLEQTLRDNNHQLRVLGISELVLQERLARTRIRAPTGWRVTARNIEPGQWVREGQGIGQAADFSTLIVPFALTPEQYAVLGDPAKSIRLQLLDLDQEVTASVFRANPGFDPVTRKISVDLEILDQVQPRRGGLRVQLNLHLPERTGTVLLPPQAVEHSYDEFWVTREDGKRLRVMLLGSSQEPEGKHLRVAAPGVEPGQRFRLLKKD